MLIQKIKVLPAVRGRRRWIALSILFAGIVTAGCEPASLDAEIEALAEKHGLTEAPLFSESFRQGWRDTTEKDFAPARVRLYVKEDGFHVLAVLSDAAIANTATGFNESTWLKGDVFEIFIEPDPGQYYEFHVTPENRNLFLRFTPEIFAAVRRGEAELETAHIADPAFIESATRIDRDKHYWTVYARIPLLHLKRDASIAGPGFRVAFARYDATPGREQPVLSATPEFPRLDFHDREAWHRLEWPSEE